MKKIHRVLITIIVFLISLILVFGVFTSNEVKKYGLDLIALTKYYVVQSPFETVHQMIKDFNDMNNLVEDKKQSKRNQELASFYQNENMELRQQISELTNLLKLNDINKQFKIKYANVIGRNFSQWMDEFTIDLGENHGIKEGQIVIGNAGIIGKIQKVSKLTSSITLITSNRSIQQISANVLSSDKKPLFGIIQGYNKKNKDLELRLFDDQKVDENSVVTTSGLGKVYPAGLTIGKVSKIEKLDNQLGQLVHVEIAQDLDNLKFVGIIVGQ